MLKLAAKPKNILMIPSLGFEVFNFKGEWYTLHLNGFGYYAYLLDGRAVYNSFTRKDNRLSMGQYKTLKFGNDTLLLKE